MDGTNIKCFFKDKMLTILNQFCIKIAKSKYKSYEILSLITLFGVVQSTITL